MRGRVPQACLAVCAAAVLAAGCGGETGDAPPPSASRSGPAGLSTTARVADCDDWNQASVDERLRTIESIAEYEGGPTTGGSGSTLPEDRAYEVFENYCQADFASGFKLYKLYVRAAGFQSLAP